MSMEFFDVSDELTINLSFVTGIEKNGTGTKVFISLNDSIKSIKSDIPFETFRTIIAKNKVAMSSIKKNLDQLAKYQTQSLGG